MPVGSSGPVPFPVPNHSSGGCRPAAARRRVGQVRAPVAVRVPAVWPVEVMLAAPIAHLPAAEAFAGWQAERKVDGWLH